MRLVSLSLRNYRNYARLDLDLSPRLNLFLGQNAQGKTNLLEAVSLLALSSSQRARRESELVGGAGLEARVEAIAERNGREVEMSIHLKVLAGESDRTSKVIRVDGQPRRAVDLPGELRATLFWPEDLNLVKGGPEYRRRFLNQMLVQVEKGYGRALAGYRRVLEQRNSLLKRIAAGSEPPSSLDVWDTELARHGELILDARRAAAAEMRPLAAANHASIAAGETLDIVYESPRTSLAIQLVGARAEDLRRGSTSVGPHRDDLRVEVAGTDARSFASQGQQRSAVVSLKLAEADLVEARSGERPILLLDDVLSELDGERRSALLARVGDRGQVIVTSVEAEPFPADLIERASVRCIASGEVVACA